MARIPTFHGGTSCCRCGSVLCMQRSDHEVVCPLLGSAQRADDRVKPCRHFLSSCKDEHVVGGVVPLHCMVLPRRSSVRAAG